MTPPTSRPTRGAASPPPGLATDIETRLRATGPRSPMVQTGQIAQTGPPTFTHADVAYAVHDTVIGRMTLAVNASGVLVSSTFTPDDAAEGRALERIARGVSPRVLRLPGRLDEARRAFDAFLVGAASSIDVSVDLVLASAFQRAVLGALRDRVGYGARASYGEVARWVGRPTAARAVGAALGANPLCLVVPCHRVVGASGDVTGYAGGLAAKRMLLQLESGRP